MNQLAFKTNLHRANTLLLPVNCLIDGKVEKAVWKNTFTLNIL